MRIIPKVPEKQEIANNSIKQSHQYQTNQQQYQTTTTNNTNNNNTNNNNNNNNITNSSYDNHQQMKYSNKTLSNNTKNVTKTTLETVNTKKNIETETTLIRSEKKSIELTEEANDEESGTDNSSYTDDSDTSVYNLSCDSTYANNFSKTPTFNFSKVDNSDGPLISSGHKVESARVSGGQKVDENENQLKKLKSSKKGKKSRLSICIAQTRYKIVGRVAKSLGWKLVRYAGHWNILWVDSDPGIEIYKEMKRYQKINHFPGMQEICRKDLLARNLGRLLKMYPNEYDFYPKTWCFPADYMEAINFNKEHKNKTFILKPDAGAQGRGIFLTKNIKDSVKPTERLICQVYVSRPLLIDGFKFDLRVYTLITTVDPLRIFVYNEGLVRMATSKYKDPNEYNIADLFMHLTNYSVNKRNDNFSHDAKLGSKRKFSSLHRNLAKEGYDIDTLWRNIDDTIIKTILSSWPMLKHNYRACFPCHDVMQACFEILGFDILVDRNLKPYILEVNQSPSFYTDESVDYEVKEALIKDTLNLLNISLIDKTKIMNEDKKRIKMRLLMTRERTKLKTVYSKTNSNTISPLGQQIAWEESHLGGFRRIMPVHVDTHRYSHLIQLQNQASIYSDTAASKRREEAGKQMRIAILEKQKRNQSILLTSKTLRRKIGPPFKRRKEYCPLKKEWSGGCIISDLEERERRKLLAERSETLKQNGVLKVILENFHKMKILSDSDRTKYGEHIKCIEQQQERDQHRLNMQNVACFSATVNDFTVKNILKNKINKADPYDDKYLSLPLVTLNIQNIFENLKNMYDIPEPIPRTFNVQGKPQTSNF